MDKEPTPSKTVIDEALKVQGDKELYDMTLTELWELFPIVLKDYNPDYPKWFEAEKNTLLRAVAGQNVYRISHIGSTAVPGLVAKPIVDILLEIDGDFDTTMVGGILEEYGWLIMSEDGSAKTIDLNKGYTKSGFADRVFHLHVKPKGDHGELYFCDYLSGHDTVAKDYGRLKSELKSRYEHDRDRYTDAKTDFITRYTALARQEFDGRYSPET